MLGSTKVIALTNHIMLCFHKVLQRQCLVVITQVAYTSQPTRWWSHGDKQWWKLEKRQEMQVCNIGLSMLTQFLNFGLLCYQTHIIGLGSMGWQTELPKWLHDTHTGRKSNLQQHTHIEEPVVVRWQGIANCFTCCHQLRNTPVITTGHHGFPADRSNSLHTTGNIVVVLSSSAMDCHLIPTHSHANTAFASSFQQTRIRVLITSTYLYSKILMTDPSRVTWLKKVFRVTISNTWWRCWLP